MPTRIYFVNGEKVDVDAPVERIWDTLESRTTTVAAGVSIDGATVVLNPAHVTHAVGLPERSGPRPRTERSRTRRSITSGMLTEPM